MAKGISARRKVVIAGVVGVCAGLASAFVLPWHLAPLLGYDVIAVLYLGWTWSRIHKLDAAGTESHANEEDPTITQADIGLLSAAAASLVAVGLVLVNAGQGGGVATTAQIIFAVASVIVSWALVHTIFMLRYASLFYNAGPDGGIDFNQKEKPRYSDFAYLAFTVGMTFQVSDTELNTSAIRAQVLKHALLSYLFGTVIVALTINMVAGLSK